MKEYEKNTRKTLSNKLYNQLEEELMEVEQEDREMYLFMRGGFSAK